MQLNTDQKLEAYVQALRMWKSGLKPGAPVPPEPDPKQGFGLTTEMDLWCARKMRKEVLGK